MGVVAAIVGFIALVLAGGCALVLVSLRNMDLSFGGCSTADDDLIVAATAGDVDEVEALLDDGADPNVEENDETPLTCAAASSRARVVGLLLDEGATADPDALRSALGARSGFVGMPLSDVPKVDRARDETVRLLLDRGVDPDGGTNGPSPLLYAAWSEQEANVDLLLERGADPNHGGRVQSTVVLMAQSYPNGSPPEVSVSMPSQLGPEADHVDNVPPLIGAAWARNSAIAAKLLDAGADPNMVSDQRFSALMAAVLQHDRPMVELLLQHGASPVPTVEPGVPSPADVAADLGYDDIAALLTPR